MFSCKYDLRLKYCMCLYSWFRVGNIIRRNVIGYLSDILMVVCLILFLLFKLLLFVIFVKFRLIGKKE